MILDYSYDKKKREFNLSYVAEDGNKQIIRRNVDKFKSYRYDDGGRLLTWDNRRCSVSFVKNPSRFDIKTYIRELTGEDQKRITGKTFPRLYTFDIETAIADDGSFPEPSEARMPITTISIVSPEMSCVVLGTRKISSVDEKIISDDFDNYLDSTTFFHELKLNNKPRFRYIYFETEESMLIYFLKNIVSNVPIISGWNCIFFDWYYITSRIKNYFPNISLNICSCTGELTKKNFTDVRGNRIELLMPVHTLVIDMMNVIKDEDYVVLPIKESYGLDYIAYASMGINKIEYDGTLQDLYNNDYVKYVYYNAIDSILVQLINYRFKSLDHVYMYSLYCQEKIDRCFSKIATTEALVFQDFYERDLKIVYEPREDTERSRLQGAYVKKPIRGFHSFVCCNDFASLYPSTIRTCNLSFENLIGVYRHEEKLREYASNPDKYIVIGPWVYENEKNAKTPSMGRLLYTLVDEEKLQKYRDNPDYFVSVTGCVYKNDQDYTFRRIQGQLKANRDQSKYLAKRLDATVMACIDHILDNRKLEDVVFDDEVISACKKIDLNITSSKDLKNMRKEQLLSFKKDLQAEITYYSCHEQAMKLLMNSMYGGCSHVAFYWYNMNVANDITGESRNLIHLMENHIPKFWRENWMTMTDLHKKLGIEVDSEAAKRALEEAPLITKEQDENAYHQQSYVYAAYGDTDSLYLSYSQLLKTIRGVDKMSIERKRDIIATINTEFLDKHNKEFIQNYYDTRFGKSVHNFELETIALSGVWLDVKKRYGQILLWKDGHVFDIDQLPMKIKGLEVVKSSFPAKSRDILKSLLRFLLENSSERYLIQRLNQEVQRLKRDFDSAPIDDVCGSVKVNNYDKYVLSDSGERIKFKGVVPWNVRALANYNWYRQRYGLSGEPIYGGKVKWYITKNSNRKLVDYFAFTSHNYPNWATKYVNIDRNAMYQQTVLDPLNRILEATSLPQLNLDGSMQISLF